jgi:hypothetical protein
MEALHPMTVKNTLLQKLERNNKNNQTEFWEPSWQAAFVFDKKEGESQKQKATSNFLWNMKLHWSLNMLSTNSKWTHGHGMKTFSSITEQTPV